MMWKLVIGLIWFVGLIMLPSHANGFWMPKTVAWLAGGLMLIGFQWLNPPTKPALRNPWIGAIFLWVSFLFVRMTLWTRLFLPQEFGPKVHYLNVTSPLIPTLVCWVSLLVIDVLVRYASSPQRWARVGLHLCIFAGVIALYGLAQYCGLDPLLLGPRSPGEHISDHAMITVFGNPMLTANCLAILAPLCLMFQPRWCRLIYGVILLSLWLTQSASSLIACLLASSILLIFRRQWLGLLGLGFFSLLGSVWLLHHQSLLSFFSFNHRWEIWATAWNFWKSHPWESWLGYGLGAVEAMTTNGVWSYGYLHCEPLQILFETGIVGFVLLCGWCWHLVIRLWRAPKNTFLMGWVASGVSFGLLCLVGFPLRIGSLLMTGVLIVAALETLLEESSHVATYPA